MHNKELRILSKTLSDLDEVAKLIITFAGSNKIWLFYGEMGAGKTTLIKHICEKLEVSDRVSSPTFSIVNEYQGEKVGKVFHFDFYRIKSETEAMDIGYEEYFYSGTYCLVEWPEKIPNLIPDQFLRINITTQEDFSRLILLSLYE